MHTPGGALVLVPASHGVTCLEFWTPDFGLVIIWAVSQWMGKSVFLSAPPKSLTSHGKMSLNCFYALGLYVTVCDTDFMLLAVSS